MEKNEERQKKEREGEREKKKKERKKKSISAEEDEDLPVMEAMSETALPKYSVTVRRILPSAQ